MVEGQIVVTEHAINRYRSRFAPNATLDELREIARNAVRAPHWVRKSKLAGHCNGTTLHVNGHIVLVIDVRRSDRASVVTVYPLEWITAAWRAQNIGDRGRLYRGGRVGKQRRRTA